MKRHVVCLIASAILGWGHVASAQGVPGGVSFTARLLDAGVPVTGNRDFVLTLFPTQTGGAQVWTETHPGVPVTAGVAFVAMGSIDPLDAARLDGSTRWLEISVNGTLMTPRLAIQSVPYAIRAGTAGNAEAVGGFTASQLQRRIARARPARRSARSPRTGRRRASATPRRR